MAAKRADAFDSGLGKALVLPAVPDDRLGALRRLARRLAYEIDQDEQLGGRALSVLSVQLRLTLAEISELEPLAADSPVEQILARREQRLQRGEVVGPSRAVPRGTTAHG
jgi:hypothetical protein